MFLGELANLFLTAERKEAILACSSFSGNEIKISLIIPALRFFCPPSLLKSWILYNDSLSFENEFCLKPILSLIAAQAWLVVASIPKIATFPRVIPWPYIAIKIVSLGKSFADELSKPTWVINSSAWLITLKSTRLVVTQGISPFQ